MLRRAFLQLLGGTLAFLAGPKIPMLEAKEVKQVGLRPSWCPEGFLPLQGQTLTKEEYPDLFLKSFIDGKNYIPPYHGKDKMTLPVDVPFIPNPLQRAGYWDVNGSRVQAITKDLIEIRVIATSHNKWSNGRPIRAGFQSAMAVSQVVFEKTYGPLGQSSKSKAFSHSGFEVPDYVRMKV